MGFGKTKPGELSHKLIFRGMTNAKLPEKVRKFAWEFAKTWDTLHSVTAAGWKSKDLNDQKYMAVRLLRNERVKRAVMEAFRKQVKLASKGESEFAINRILKMHKNIEKITNNLVSNLENKTNISEKDLAPLMKLLEFNKDMVKMSGAWLGYDEKEESSESFKMQLEGRRAFGGFLPKSKNEIPETIKAEVVDDSENNEEEVPNDASGISFDNVLPDSLINEKPIKKDANYSGDYNG